MPSNPQDTVIIVSERSVYSGALVGGPTGPTGLKGATGSTGPGLPPGGTENQVLTKINSTDYNTQWSDPVTADYLGGTKGSGNWWLNQSGSTTTQAAGSLYNYLILAAFYIPETVTVDRVAVHVSVLGSGDIRLGLYAHDPTTGRPSSRLADWGLVSTTTTGIKELTISHTFNKGWYWFANCWQTSNTTAHTWTANPLNTLNIPVFIGTSSANMSSSRGTSYYNTGVTGALPSSASGYTSININNSMRAAFRTA